MALVYLGGPIDLVDNESRTAWRDTMKEWLMRKGISSFDPCGAFHINPNNPKVAKSLIEINKTALMGCDFAVLLMSRQPSIGTPIELYMAHVNRIPHVVIWLSDGPLPMYVSGFADHVVSTIDDAVEYIHYKMSNQVENLVEGMELMP